MTKDTRPDANERDIPDMELFKQIFCHDRVHSHLLGLFDCVKSTGRFGQHLGNQRLPTTIAKHVRHAVAINEYREHLVPTLFKQEVDNQESDHLVEMWFVGCHKDIGCSSTAGAQAFPTTVSDIPLAWMLAEIGALPCPNCVVRWETIASSSVKDTVKELEDSVIVLPGTKEVHDPLDFTHSRRSSLAIAAIFLWRFCDMMISFMKFDPSPLHRMIRVSNNARKQPTGACRTFHSSVIALYRRGLLGREDTPQSVIAHSEAMDNHQDLVFRGDKGDRSDDIFRIVKTPWYDRHGSQGRWDLTAQDTQSPEDSPAAESVDEQEESSGEDCKAETNCNPSK
ncbi:MAG: hypothetical protein Q9221_007816 [Calogaya cf. arnoldii]